MLQTELSIRAFRWGDFDALVGFLRAEGPEEASGTIAERMWRSFNQPGFYPERDCLLAMDGESVAGYLLMHAEHRIQRAVLEGRVTLGHEGVRRLLLGRLLTHARKLELNVAHMNIAPHDAIGERLLRSMDFNHVRTHLHLRRTSRAASGIVVPLAMRVRPMMPEEIETLAMLQNAAFADSWGYQPNTAEELRYRVYDLPLVKPDEVLFLEYDSKVAAYCWTHLEALGGPGVIAMVGTHPDYRGKGIGGIITAAGVDHFVSQGVSDIHLTVDSDNPSAARIYGKLGFVERAKSLWYELALQEKKA